MLRRNNAEFNDLGQIVQLRNYCNPSISTLPIDAEKNKQPNYFDIIVIRLWVLVHIFDRCIGFK